MSRTTFKGLALALFLGASGVVAEESTDICPTTYGFEKINNNLTIENITHRPSGFAEGDNALWIAYFSTRDCNGEIIKTDDHDYIGYSRGDIVSMLYDPNITGELRKEVEEAHEALMTELCTGADIELMKKAPNLFVHVDSEKICPSAF
jgi:hypothetical protein